MNRYDVDVSQEHATAALWRIRELASDGMSIAAAKDQALSEIDLRHLSKCQQDLTRQSIEQIDHHDVGRQTCSQGAMACWDTYEREHGPFAWYWRYLYRWFGMTPTG